MAFELLTCKLQNVCHDFSRQCRCPTAGIYTQPQILLAWPSLYPTLASLFNILQAWHGLVWAWPTRKFEVRKHVNHYNEPRSPLLASSLSSCRQTFEDAQREVGSVNMSL